MVTSAAPFYDSNGGFLGVATADMDLNSLQKIVNELKIGTTGKAFLLTKEGTYIAGVDANKVMKAKLTDDKRFSSVNKDILSGKSSNQSYKDGNDSPVVYYSSLGDTKWILGITVSNSEKVKSLRSLLATITVLSTILIALIALTIIIFSNYITKSIGKVNKLTSIVSSGDLTYELEITSEDELGVMSKNLNKMSSDLKTTFIEIVNSLDNIVGTSEELTASSEQTQSSAEQVVVVMRVLSNGSSNQAMESKEILEQVTHIYDGIKNISENVNSTSKLSKEATEIAESGKGVIIKAVEQISDISGRVSESTDIVVSINNVSNQMALVVDIIQGLYKNSDSMIKSVQNVTNVAKAGS